MRRFYIFDMDGTLCDSMALWRKETLHLRGCGTREQYEAAYKKMREYYTDKIELKSGAVRLLERARAAGIRCCIASATRYDVALPLLERTGLMDYMEFYIDCHEVGKFKTDPDIYLMAAERLGAKVEECVVFEDSEYCAKTARNAGFFVVGVYDSVASSEGDTKSVSDVYINDLSAFDPLSI